jgi:class 3 adenylate cyclase
MVAYQVVGDADLDLIFLLGWPSNLAMQWELPAFARFLTGLGSFSRLILLDRPGTGLSDRGPTEQSFEDRLDDILCVMDAVGSDRSALFGCHIGGRLAILFAATYPERTSAVVTFGAHPTTLADDDYPWGIRPEEFETLTEAIGRGLTDEEQSIFLHMLAPDADPGTAAWWLRFVPSSVTPREGFDEVSRLGSVDIRSALGTVRVPTLIMHRSDDQAALAGASRYMAERIPGSRFVELPGADHFPFLGDPEPVLELTEEFLTGSTPVRQPDRVLATIMFTDIVDSTGRAARIGDRRWKETLSAHDERVREALARFRGKEIETTGDGFLAMFDGPARAVRCALLIEQAMGEIGLEVRAGCHTGEVQLEQGYPSGIAVHIGARVAALAGPSEVWVSSTVKDLVTGSGLTFEDAGEHELKGVPDRWHLYRVKEGEERAPDGPRRRSI